MKEENQKNNFNNDYWGLEAEKNWTSFWDLIFKEDARQNPHKYKKSKNIKKLKNKKHEK